MPWKTVGLTRLGVKLTSMVQPQQDRHILEAKHAKRALEAHMTTVEALYDLSVEEFCLDHPHLKGPCVEAAQQLDQSCVQHLQQEMLKEQQNMLTILDSQRALKMMAEFDNKKGSQSSLFKFVGTYMRMVLAPPVPPVVALHEHTGSSVRQGGKLSTRFLTTSRVRQGCVLAPALFCVAIDWILNHMDANPGIRVYLVYADDTILFATSSQSAVESLSSFQNAASVFGMHISWPKTKVQNLGTDQPLSDVSVDAHHMECVDNFTYLGSVQSSDGYCRPDIRRRIALAASGSSLRNIWKNQRLSLTTKTRIYQTLVVSVLLYASETWTLLAADVKTLEAFHMKCQRQILRFSAFAGRITFAMTRSLHVQVCTQ